MAMTWQAWRASRAALPLPRRCVVCLVRTRWRHTHPSGTLPGVPFLPTPFWAAPPCPLQDAVRRDFEPRCAALQRLLCLPPLAAEPYDALAAAAGKERLAQLLLHGLPVQQAQQQQAQQQRDASPEAARAAAGVGVALLGSAAFEARARLLALCGWDLKLISTAGKAAAGSSGAAAAGSPAGQEDHGLPAHVGPESAALECGVCSAKAGLWAFFPQCKPHVLQAARRSGGAGGTLASPSSAAVAKAAVSRSVAADIGTTITGGAMQTGAPAAAVPAAAPPP